MNMRSPSAPNNGANPEESGYDQEDNCAQRENLEGTMPFTQTGEKQGQDTVSHGEDGPRDKSSDEKTSRQAVKSHQGDR
jgi:hypothetical protein